MTRLEDSSNEKSASFGAASFHHLEFKQQGKEKPLPSITQQKGHNISNATASPKQAGVFKRIGDFFANALNFLTKPFKSTKTIKATHIETSIKQGPTVSTSRNILELQAKEFVTILKEIKAVQSQNKETQLEKKEPSLKQELNAPAQLVLPTDFEEVVALGNQNLAPAPLNRQSYQETIASNVESMRILREIQEDKLRPFLQEKFEAAYKEIEGASVALKALSPFDPNFERVQETIKERAKALLREIQDLTDRPEIMQLPVVQALQVLGGQTSKTHLDPKSTELLNNLVEELSKSGGGIRNLELTAAIARTPVGDLIKIWEEYTLRTLTADSASAVPLATMGLAFQNINRNFSYNEIVSANPFISHGLKADEAYQQTYMSRLTQLAKLDQGIKTSKNNLLNVIENSVKIFKLDPSTASLFRRTLSQSENIYLEDGPISDKRARLDSARSEFMLLHKQWLDAVKNKMDTMSDAEKEEAKKAIKQAIPQYNTAMYQNSQFDSLVAITAQWQMPAFTDTLFDTMKNALTAQARLKDTNPNVGT